MKDPVRVTRFRRAPAIVETSDVYLVEIDALDAAVKEGKAESRIDAFNKMHSNEIPGEVEYCADDAGYVEIQEVIEVHEEEITFDL